MTAVGIDFGTTNSVVATWNGRHGEALSIDTPLGEWERLGFDRVMPSVFARSPGGDALFGWAAKRSSQGRFEAVKRLFATQQDTVSDDEGGVFAVEEVATMLFAEFKAAAARQGVDAGQAVVTVPANSRGLARHRTKICAGMGGLEVLALMNEPTAASLAYAVRNPGDQQVLVFDWGGGTLDVTILRSVSGVFLEQASKGLPTKGGLDFDSRLRRLVLETVPDRSTWTGDDRRRFDLDIELAKIRLSTQDYTIVQLPDGDSRRITRGMFEDSISSLIEESRLPIERCLRDIGAGPSSIDAVIMVGGTSRIPAVRRFVGDLLEREPEVDIDPMTAVGEGAAVAAAILTGELETNDFFVATEHALGTVVLDPDRMESSFSVLIPRNHKLPAQRTDTFHPIYAEQEGVRLRVIEGDPEVPVEHPDNVILKEWEIDIPDGSAAKGMGFDITYEYDVDGILHVRAVDNFTGGLMLEDDVSYGITGDKRQLVQMSRRAQEAVASGTAPEAAASPTNVDPEASRLLQQTYVKVIPFLDGDEADELRRLASAVESASGGDLADAKARLAAALAPFSYLF
ncbi:MAG: Hsp70 family protein [Acidimicrobiales bacterium]